MELYAGLDLHSRNTFIGILDKEFKQVFKKRVPNIIELILDTLNQSSLISKDFSEVKFASLKLHGCS